MLTLLALICAIITILSILLSMTKCGDEFDEVVKWFSVITAALLWFGLLISVFSGVL
jgi:hypothetical protein